MACALTSGRTEPCKDAAGGLKKAYFIDWIEDAFTVSGSQATAINVGITAVFQYDLLSDTNTLVETMTPDTNNGTRVVEQVLTLGLKKQTYQSAAEFNLVAAARPIIVVVDNMDNHKVVGLTRGTNVVIESQSGGALGDFNGYNITATGTELKLAPSLDASTITALEALISATNVSP